MYRILNRAYLPLFHSTKESFDSIYLPAKVGELCQFLLGAELFLIRSMTTTYVVCYECGVDTAVPYSPASNPFRYDLSLVRKTTPVLVPAVQELPNSSQRVPVSISSSPKAILADPFDSLSSPSPKQCPTGTTATSLLRAVRETLEDYTGELQAQVKGSCPGIRTELFQFSQRKSLDIGPRMCLSSHDSICLFISVGIKLPWR